MNDPLDLSWIEDRREIALRPGPPDAFLDAWIISDDVAALVAEVRWLRDLSKRLALSIIDNPEPTTANDVRAALTLP